MRPGKYRRPYHAMRPSAALWTWACEFLSQNPSDAISVTPHIPPSDRVRVGQEIKAVVAEHRTLRRLTLFLTRSSCHLGRKRRRLPALRNGGGGIERTVSRRATHLRGAYGESGLLAEPNEALLPRMLASGVIKSLNQPRKK